MNFGHLFSILCMILCLVQIILLNEVYFSYDTMVNIMFETSEQIQLPGITICYNKAEQVQIFDNDSMKHFNDRPISEQVNLIKNFKLKLFMCKVKFERYTDSDCQTITKLTRSFNERGFCVTLFNQVYNQSQNV